MKEKLSLDARHNAFRPDLADVSLQTVYESESYARPQIHQCVRGVVPMMVDPSETANRISEIRYGEFVDVFEKRADGFAWVQNRMDRVVGYVKMDGALTDAVAELSGRVKTLHTPVYAKPERSSPVVDRLTLGSYVQAFPDVDGFSSLVGGGFVAAQHIVPVDLFDAKDYVFHAGRLLGAPYLQGGRTPLGVDGPGLVQLALELAGMECPRFADVQQQAFGVSLPHHWRDYEWLRGDLVFLDDHVGLMVDHTHLIHADSTAMEVVVTPLVDLVLSGYSVTGVGRVGPR